MDEVELAGSLRAHIKNLRTEGKIPTEVRLSQSSWNTLRRQLTYGSIGSRQTVQFDGLPCVLAFGIRSPSGFAVKFVDPPPE